jgi:hypothetical protein
MILFEIKLYLSSNKWLNVSQPASPYFEYYKEIWNILSHICMEYVQTQVED